MDAFALTSPPLSHNGTLGDPGVCVAVLDGPVDMGHPCFAGADITRLDTLVHDPAGPGPMSTHGTHVASVIFGQPGSPVPGIAPRCRGLIAPVFREGERRLSQLDLARAIEQAVQAGAHIINISGGQQSPEGQAEGVLGRALRLCEDSNVLVIAAVGNDGCPCLHVPAAVPSVLGVGALGADGTPLESSNWGEGYRSHAILAPGEKINGASPGGGTVLLTGSSFATPIVSGAAAVLLSIQVSQGRRPDPREVRRVLLDTALSCQPRDGPECQRYLVGTLNIPGAYASITKGGMTVANNDTAQATFPAAGSPAAETDIPAAVMTEADPASEGPGPGVRSAADPATGGEAASQLSPPPVPAQVVPAHAPSSGVVAAGDCGCGGGKKSYVFALGMVGFDFGTEARRDSFRQLMLPIERGEPPVQVPPNPYDVIQLYDYLEEHKSESTKLIWTLNLDLTPIYALEAELAYADDVYEQLRGALRNQVRPTTDNDYVSRVSIPGVLTNRTRRLFSGQVVPVVTVQHRGLFSWSETQLIEAILEAVLRENPNAAQEQVRLTLRNFLDKIYYQLRNLGQNPSDRALNFAGTNAFQFTQVVADGILSAKNVPGGQNLYALDTITVAKSPYCRMDSDCWDVTVTFFDPENDRRARAAYLFTIDVSDEMPVSLAPTHQFLIAS